MKSFFKHFLLLAVIVMQSCSNNDDEDCSTVTCDVGYADLNFQIIDNNTGENVFNNIASSEAITVVRTSDNLEAEFEIIEKNEQKTLVIYTLDDAKFSVMYADEELFTVLAEAETITQGCCPSTRITDLSIDGAEFTFDEGNNIYIIERSVRSHLITDESLENYHAFFENSKLQIEAEDESHVNTESLEIDVVTGGNLVFKLLTYDDPEETVADDELTKIVYFEIDPEATEFTLNSDNFEEARAVIGLSASISFIKFIESGEITGTKISNDIWEVEVNVSVGEEDESFSIQVQESKTDFNKSTYEDVWMPIYYTHVFN